jgi:hypothetical protein
MAIRQLIDFQLLLVGDGNATSIAVDMTNYISKASVIPTVPNGTFSYGVDCADDSTLAIQGVTVLVAVVTVTFNHAIPGGSRATVSMTLKF